MSISDVVILFTTVLICSVSNQNIEPKEGTQIFLTKELNVQPSPIVPFDFTTQNVNAVPNTEIEATRPVPIQETKLPANVKQTQSFKTDSEDAPKPNLAFTIEPTPILAPILLGTEVKSTWEMAAAIAPTQVVRPGAPGSFTAPLNNLTPPKE